MHLCKYILKSMYSNIFIYYICEHFLYGIARIAAAEWIGRGCGAFAWEA